MVKFRYKDQVNAALRKLHSEPSTLGLATMVDEPPKELLA